MEFKRLPDFPKYKIYKNGDIYREWKNKDKLVKHCLNKYGYYCLYLLHNGKRKFFYIHRLLAILFIPNTDLKNQTVDHINRVRTDNRIENLRWLDRSGQKLNQDLKDSRRAKLEDAIELVRQTLLENEWVFDGYDRDKINTIKIKYNMS